MRSADTFESLVSSKDPSYKDFYRIYTESILPVEQKPEAALQAMTARPDYKITLAKRDGLTVGFSILFTPHGERFCLLEYMGVDSAYRALGIGGELFRRNVEATNAERGGTAMLLEVDSEREHSADQSVRRKRKNFYRRLGCLQIAGLHYILPLPGKDVPPAMDLMIYLTASTPHLRKSQLKRWLGVIYQRVYNCLPNDPRISLMMESVTDPVRME
jgi:ribosomal protein S18 acetylase RimI-like enzyme